MKKRILYLALSLILSINSFSQILFENGYFINDSNEKIECLIKNMDWKNNPTSFEYKLSQDAGIQNESIETVKEFGINGVSKYIRATVNIDKSRNEINKLSSERKPLFQQEILFLKVLVEGKASLFFYEKGNHTRFFYKINDSEITQLIYKLYLLDTRNIAQNNFFRQQIFIDLKFQEITWKNIENINYNSKELEKLFVVYNECTNSEFINYGIKQKKDFFNLSVRPGFNFSNLTIKNSRHEIDTDFGNKLNFRFGIEAEFIFPYNKRKWGIIIEPTYQYFNSERTSLALNVSGGSIVSTANYQSIELPIGVRHYFFLNDESKIFADISFIFDFSNNSEIKFTRIDGSEYGALKINAIKNLGLGIGYKLKDKYSIGMRYQTSRQVLSDYVYWNSSYNTYSIIMGYTLF